MPGESEEHQEYTDEFVAGLECMWGDGFLSPGGAEEVAAILEPAEVEGLEILDVGCGLGAVDCLLVAEHGAARVVGIDIEAPLIERARAAVAGAGLADRVEIRLVEPGPLPFDPGSFDVVFSKDSIIHVPDKSALFAEVLRVLRPGGCFVASDWLRGGEGPVPSALRAWLDIVGLTFEMENLEQMGARLGRAGFTDVRLRDRNAWYREEIRREVEAIAGDGHAQLAARVGETEARRRVRSNAARQAAVEAGDLRPAHLYGRKPVRA